MVKRATWSVAHHQNLAKYAITIMKTKTIHEHAPWFPKSWKPLAHDNFFWQGHEKTRGNGGKRGKLVLRGTREMGTSVVTFCPHQAGDVHCLYVRLPIPPPLRRLYPTAFCLPILPFNHHSASNTQFALCLPSLCTTTVQVTSNFVQRENIWYVEGFYYCRPA